MHFNLNQLVRHVIPNHNSNFIIEVQVPNPSAREGFSSIGWSLINLFNEDLSLNKGKFRLPVYRPPTLVNLDVRDIKKLRLMLDVTACLRICVPKDDVFTFQATKKTGPRQYLLPKIHDIERPDTNHQNFP